MAGKLSRTNDDFIQESNIVHNFKYDYSNTVYTGTAHKVDVICPVHGEFSQLAGAHLAGRGCSRCGIESVGAGNVGKFTSNLGLFVEKAKTIHGDKYNYDKFEYVNNKVHGLVICNQCGCEWRVRPDSHLHSKSGCPTCNQNKVIYTRSYYDAKGIEDHECKLYFIEISSGDERFLKIGLTTGSLRHRFRGLLKRIEIEEVFTYTGTFFQLYEIEQEILSRFKDYRYVPSFSFKGHTECFNINVKFEIQSSLIEILGGNSVNCGNQLKLEGTTHA